MIRVNNSRKLLSSKLRTRPDEGKDIVTRYKAEDAEMVLSPLTGSVTLGPVTRGVHARLCELP